MTDRLFHFRVTVRRRSDTTLQSLHQHIDRTAKEYLAGYESTTFIESEDLSPTFVDFTTLDMETLELGTQGVMVGSPAHRTLENGAPRPHGRVLLCPSREYANKRRIEMATERANKLREEWQQLTIASMTWEVETIAEAKAKAESGDRS